MEQMRGDDMYTTIPILHGYNSARKHTSQHDCGMHQTRQSTNHAYLQKSH